MSFVLIVEPDEVNAARIRTILESLELDFSYQLVTSAEAGILYLEEHTPDVFVGDMQMPVISAAELFSMAEMMVPDMIRIVMTDGGQIEETIDFINECRAYKIIIKPCRVADDLLVPIHAAIQYKEQRRRAMQLQQKAAENRAVLEKEYNRLNEAALKSAEDMKRAQDTAAEIIGVNIDADKELDDMIKERLKRWYQWMLEEYGHQVINGSGDYEKVLRNQLATFHNPEHGCVFMMKKNTPNEIIPRCMNEIAYVIRLTAGVCKDLQSCYQIHVLLEEAEMAYILRMRFIVDKDAQGIELPAVHRVRNEKLRNQIKYAVKLGIAALGCKTAVKSRESDDILNVAIAKN